MTSAARTEPDPSTVFVQYRPRRALRRLLLAGVAGTLLLAGLGYAVRTTVASPESTVEAFFAALADRDADAALHVTAPEVADQVARDLIDDAVLAADGYQPPEEVSVGTVTVDGRAATAEVAFTVDGRRSEVSLRLRRDEGIAGALWHRWLVVDGVGSLLLREVPERVTVNGRAVPAYDAQGPRILPALPGSYRVGVPPDHPLWEPRDLPVRVVPQRAVEVDVPLVAHPAVRDQVDRQVVQLLDRCAASTELVPAGCPFGYGVAGSAEDVRWRILSYPRIGLSAGPDPDLPVAAVHTATEGEAMITGTRRFVGGFEDTVPIPVSGTVRVSGDAVVFQPGW